MTREQQLLKDAGRVGLCWLGEPPPEILKLWNEGWLRRSEDLPHVYTAVVIEEVEDEDSVHLREQGATAAHGGCR